MEYYLVSIINEIDKSVRPYIGEPITAETKPKIQRIVNKILSSYISKGYIPDSFTPEDFIKVTISIYNGTADLYPQKKFKELLEDGK